MGKPAARTFLDIGAHIGPIITGSFNVFIGNGMAARKGDAVTCPLHGIASIVEGSSSVFINGMPAARMGDKTSCGTTPMPIPVGPKPAPDDISYITASKDINEDKTVKSRYPDDLTVRGVYAYAGKKDRTGDGNYDQVVAGAGLVDFRVKSQDWTPFGKEYGGIGASGGFSILKGDALAGAYGSNGVYGVEANAKATGLSGDVEAHIGKEDVLYVKGEAKGDVGYAELGADAELYTGGSEKKYGGYIGGVAEAGIARGSVGATADLLGSKLGDSQIKKIGKDGKPVKGKTIGNYIEGKVGGVGGDIGLGGYLDTDDYLLNVKAKLGAELGLGLEISMDITIKFWGWFDEKKAVPEVVPVPTVIPGVILTGYMTVLIG